MKTVDFSETIAASDLKVSRSRHLIEYMKICEYCITKTSPCNEHPFTPHFYIVKLGFTGVYIIFLFLLQNIYCGYSLEPPQI